MWKLYFHVNVSLVLIIVYMHTVTHPLSHPSLNHPNCLNFIHILLFLVLLTHWVQCVLLMCVCLWVHPLEHGEPTRGHTVNREWFSILHITHQECPVRDNDGFIVFGQSAGVLPLFTQHPHLKELLYLFLCFKDTY